MKKEKDEDWELKIIYALFKNINIHDNNAAAVILAI